MDQERFDQLARSLVAARSRRGLVRDLAGAAVGGILVAAGTGTAGATTQRGGRQGQDRAAASASRKKRRCKSPNTKCGKGKKAPCCTCQQDCSGNSCVPKSETVRIRFVPFSGDSNFCTIWVDVTGFADGPYTANVATYGSHYSTPITVTSGTGSGVVNGGALFQNNATSGNHYTVLATLEGVCSDTVPLTCAAT